MLNRLTLERAIQELPPGYRAVFVLHDVEGHDHPETARICGISIGTTKSQLHKARRKLRALLQAENVQPVPQMDRLDEAESMLRLHNQES